MYSPTERIPFKMRTRSVASYVLGIQELLDHTIDYLSDSPCDLISCALVAKSWVYRARRHIYRSLDLTPDDQSGCNEIEIKFHRLSHTLQMAPHLVSLIRGISVPLNSGVLADLAGVPFTHLAELRLECTSYPWAAAAQPATVAPLQILLRLPSLRRAHLWGYLEPISILDDYFEGCSRDIQHLHLALDNLEAYPGACAVVNDSPCPPRPMIPLAHLSIPRELETWMRGLRCPFDFTQLTSLELRATDWAPMQGTLAPCLPQLELLGLTSFSQDSDIDLRALPALKRLNVSLVETTDGLRALAALLARLPPWNEFRHLAITFPEDPIPHERAVREFDVRIAALAVLRCLKIIEIQVPLLTCAAENIFRRYLPQMASKAQLCIYQEVFAPL
ncbi:hypothetical protein DFH09DRAFT_1318209 [Mycena vulgaris]|nr:hypothetical protein DFH09DRAFT_1318209 [Mycena vulgaris]